MTLRHTRILIAGGLLLAGAGLFAAGTRFSDYTPLSSSAPPTSNEAEPITFGNPDFEQESIADRETQLADGKPNTGDWDMITLNETGRDAGRYLFTVFESDQSGVQRHDLLTGQTETIWLSPEFEAHTSFDPSFWTPWGTFVTAEEELVHERDGMHRQHSRPPVRAQESPRCPWHHRAVDTTEQRWRGLRASERDSEDLPRRHPVGQRREHVFHRRAERRQPLQVHIGGGFREGQKWAAKTTSPPARHSCCESATATRRTPPGRTSGWRLPTKTAIPCPGP